MRQSLVSETPGQAIARPRHAHGVRLSGAVQEFATIERKIFGPEDPQRRSHRLHVRAQARESPFPYPTYARGTHAALTAARTAAQLPELDGDAAVRRAPGVRGSHCHSALPFAVPLGFSMQKRTRWREMTVRPSFVQRSRAGSARRRATGPTGHAPGPRRSRRGGSRVTSRGI